MQKFMGRGSAPVRFTAEIFMTPTDPNKHAIVAVTDGNNFACPTKKCPHVRTVMMSNGEFRVRVHIYRTDVNDTWLKSVIKDVTERKLQCLPNSYLSVMMMRG